jgi:hypothetical protein
MPAPMITYLLWEGIDMVLTRPATVYDAMLHCIESGLDAARRWWRIL